MKYREAEDWMYASSQMPGETERKIEFSIAVSGTSWTATGLSACVDMSSIAGSAAWGLGVSSVGNRRITHAQR